jgi:HK97 family phage major capsid protein
MAKSKMTVDQQYAHLEKFIAEHEGEDGLLSAEDAATFDMMLAGYRNMGGRRSFKTQAELNNSSPQIKGGQGQGIKLVDEKGRVHRALASGESFADAIRESPEPFGVSADQLQYCDDGLTLGGYLRAMVAGPQTSAERWALSESNSTSGGYTVPAILAAMVIDRFRAKLVVSQAGAQTLPLDSESHSFAKLTGDPTAAWRQETVSITESDPTFGRLTFHPKSLAVLVKATRELLQDSPNIGQMIERSISGSMAVEVDRVALLGAGAAAEPMGLRYATGLNEITGIAALTDYSDFIDGYKLMMDDNAPEPTAAIVSNREWATLAKLEDTTGQALRLPPAVENLPFMAASALPTNLGGGTESLAFLGHFPDLVLGMRAELQIEVLKELFASTHHYGYIAHLRMDTGIFHAESFVRMLGITP